MVGFLSAIRVQSRSRRGLIADAPDIDVREVLPDIAVPTLVMHRTYDMLIPVERACYTAARITGARYVEQPGEDHMYWLGDQDSTLSAIRQFLAATPDGAPIAALRQSRRLRLRAGRALPKPSWTSSGWSRRA